MPRAVTFLVALAVAGASSVVFAQVGPLAPPMANKTSRRAQKVTVKPRVVITVVTRNSLGKVFCAMWRGSEGFPTKRKQAAHDGIDRKLRNKRGLIILNDVEPGEYGIACFHDENANNDLDTNFLGIPVEGTGASNDAHGFMGPPSYEDARFQVLSNQTKRVVVPMRYIF